MAHTASTSVSLPSILSAPDLGQMLITCPGTTGRIEGNRAEKWVTVTFELPLPNEAAPVRMDFAPVVLPMPDGFHNEQQWKAARRGWFNLIQQSCGACAAHGCLDCSCKRKKAAPAQLPPERTEDGSSEV